MTDRREEETAAALVEFVLRHEGTPIGGWTRRDGSDTSGLTVDFTFDEVEPGLALEVTSIHGKGDPALSSEGGRLEERLTEKARSEKLGQWVVVLNGEARVREAEPRILEILRGGESIRPGTYSSADLLAMSSDSRKAFIAKHVELRALHVIDVVKLGNEHDGVAYMAMSGRSGFQGLGDHLERAVNENVSKLREARPRETHLAIVVHDYHVSRDPQESQLLALPPELDCLWIIHSWPADDGRLLIWRHVRDGDGWIEIPLPPEVLGSLNG